MARKYELKKQNIYCIVGRDSAVGIATRYALDGPGIESRCGRDFPHPSRPALWPTRPPTQWAPGVKRPDHDHPPHLAQRLKKELSYTSDLYFSWASWPVLGWTLLIALLFICLRNLKFVKRKQICFFIAKFILPFRAEAPLFPFPSSSTTTYKYLFVRLGLFVRESGGIRIWNAAKLKIHSTAGKVKI